jgi:hypothetical protein
MTALFSNKLKAGDVMPAGHPHAGWIYVGISDTTGKPLYAASKDSGVFKWKEAMAFAAKEKASLPTEAELDQLYKAKDVGAFKGTFNVSGSDPAGWYWSATEDRVYAGVAYVQGFSDGFRVWDVKFVRSVARLVRS